LDIRDIDRRSLQIAGATIAQVKADHLDLPTPCGDWTLRGLLRHLVSENEGFAAAVGNGSAPRTVWDGGRLGDDPYRAYEASAELVTSAFAPGDALDRDMEVREFGVFPGRVALSLHAVDFLVHGWDVAAAIGVPYEPDDELAATALKIASRWPDAPETRGPGAAFDTRVEVPEDASDFQRLLGLLGRSPQWVLPC
jgi:uncharacterized protein (TIGR03086 family)